MLGAIIGDIVGSRFEFNNHRSERFNMFDKKCFFTDDTVMTCAVADCFAGIFPENYPSSELIKLNFRRMGALYPYAGYGGLFRAWLNIPTMEAYNSFGNGAAMRISPVAYVAKSETQVKHLSRIITGVTHNHEEGYKGAEVTAVCIYKALHGANKKEIFKYARSQYPYINNMDLDELREKYYFNETCQQSVPQAIFCFLISESFEDCIRKTISIGGDSDTLCSISCSIAEAYYGIPEEMKAKVLEYFSDVDKEVLLKPIQEVYEISGRKNYIPL